MPFGPLLAWKRGDLYGAAQRLTTAGLIALVVVVATFAVTHRGPWIAPFALALGVFVMAGAITEVAYRVKAGRADWQEVRRRLLNLPRAAYGSMLAHFGIGMMVVGIVGTTAYQTEVVKVMKAGDSIEIAVTP